MSPDAKTPRTVSLVLGSGGARGLAHIGVIRWLEANGYVIQSISGCSIGALVGGIHAAGKLDEFEQWVRAITRRDILSLMDISWSKSGLLKGDRVINTLAELVGHQTIETLPIRFTAVAADVRHEKEVWLTSGSLFDAIRASISLPLLLTPHLCNGVLLIDGGVLNPVPIAPTFSDNTDLTLAVNLGGPVEIAPPSVPETPVASPPVSVIHEKIGGFIKRLQPEKVKSLTPDWGIYDVANQAFDAMQSTIARHKLAAYPPDVAIEIARNACGTLEFDRAAEMIDLGYRKAGESLKPLPA